MKHIRFFDPKTNINFISMLKTAWIVTGLLVVVVIGGIAIFGMPWGIDFLGGLEMQVKFDKPVSANEIRDVLEELDFDKNQVQTFGPAHNNEMLVRIESMAAITDTELERLTSLVSQQFPKNSAGAEAKVHFDKKNGSQLAVWLPAPYSADSIDHMANKNLLNAQKKRLADVIETNGKVELRRTATVDGEIASNDSAIHADEPNNNLVRYTVQFAGVTGKIQRELEKKFGTVQIRQVVFVDSQVSRQLRTDGWLAVIYAILAIVIYIAIRFDMYFSPGAIFSLVNDVLGALLIFVVFRLEFDVPSIAALLTVIGYSVNNTVVIYDRIRETMPDNPKKPLSMDETKVHVNKAINDTMSRTINTTLTTLLASIPICIFTSGAIQNFAIVLSAGIVIGAFSSVFVAPAAYLLAKKYIKPAYIDDNTTAAGPSREERAKGVV